MSILCQVLVRKFKVRADGRIRCRHWTIGVTYF